jgi:hypothetical protein
MRISDNNRNNKTVIMNTAECKINIQYQTSRILRLNTTNESPKGKLTGKAEQKPRGTTGAEYT